MQCCCLQPSRHKDSQNGSNTSQYENVVNGNNKRNRIKAQSTRRKQRKKSKRLSFRFRRSKTHTHGMYKLVILKPCHWSRARWKLWKLLGYMPLSGTASSICRVHYITFHSCAIASHNACDLSMNNSYSILVFAINHTFLSFFIAEQGKIHIHYNRFFAVFILYNWYCNQTNSRWTLEHLSQYLHHVSMVLNWVQKKAKSRHTHIHRRLKFNEYVAQLRNMIFCLL